MSAACEVTGWRELPGSVRRALWSEFFREDLGTLDGEAMGATIHALRAQLTRMACPVCGTVNPPDVHTCTPRVVTDGWLVWGRKRKGGKRHLILSEHGGLFPYAGDYEAQMLAAGRAHGITEYDSVRASSDPADWRFGIPVIYAPHTVKRVALIDEPTTRGEG